MNYEIMLNEIVRIMQKLGTILQQLFWKVSDTSSEQSNN